MEAIVWVILMGILFISVPTIIDLVSDVIAHWWEKR